MAPYAGRRLLIAGIVGWALCALYVVACWASPSIVGDAGCELGSGSSVFGEASRSWLPPGTTCTYDLSTYGLPADVVIGPSPLRLLVLGVALAGPPVLVYMRGLLRNSPIPGQPVASARGPVSLSGPFRATGAGCDDGLEFEGQTAFMDPELPQVDLALWRDDAIVLFDWLMSVDFDAVPVTHRAQRQALLDLLNRFEQDTDVIDVTQAEIHRAQESVARDMGP